MEWAAPDVTPADGPVAPTRAPGEATSPAPDPPSVPRLAPMTVPDILDGGFAILKRAPATIIGLTAAFLVPIQAWGAWLNRGSEGLDLDALLEQSDTSFQIADTSGASGTAAVLLTVGPSVALVFVAASIARLVSAWHVGHDIALGDLLRGTLKRTWPLLAAWTLVHALEAVAVIGLGVLPLAVMTWFLVTAPVIGAEGLGPIDAMRRSARLVSRRFWNVLGIALLSFLVETLFDSAIGLVPSLVSLWVGTDGVAWILPAVIGIATTLITMPVVAAVTVLVYLDLRVRTEGLDLELDALEAFPTAA